MIGSTSKDQKATSLCTLGSHKPVIPVVNSSHIPSARRAEVSELKATSTPVYDLGVIAFPLPVLLHVARPGMAIPPSRVSVTRTSPIFRKTSLLLCSPKEYEWLPINLPTWSPFISVLWGVCVQCTHVSPSGSEVRVQANM